MKGNFHRKFFYSRYCYALGLPSCRSCRLRRSRSLTHIHNRAALMDTATNAERLAMLLGIVDESWLTLQVYPRV